MADFNFIQDPSSKKWVILAPRRAKRPDVAVKTQSVCPFCYGKEKEEPDVYRVGGGRGDTNWQIRVVPNKFPFAQLHEIIIHSPDHHKNFGELPLDQVELILKTYQQRYNFYREKGTADFYEESTIIGKKHNLTPKQIANFIINKKVTAEETLPAKLVESMISSSSFEDIDPEEIKKTVKEIIKSNPSSLKDYKNGKSQVIDYLVGQVLRQMKRKLDTNIIKNILKDELK